MADITFNYKGNTIGEISASGTHTLDTQGQYCEDDIEVVYVAPGGGGGPLPAGYTLLEYVELTGSQYLKTTIEPVQNDEIKATMQLKLGNTSGAWFSCGTGTYQWLLLNNSYYKYFASGNAPQFSPALSTGAVYDIEAAATCTAKSLGANTSTATSSYGGATDGNDKKLYIGVRANLSAYFKGYIYSFGVYRNDEAILYLLPCVRNADDKAGLYDIVGNTFYLSDGNDDFVAGPAALTDAETLNVLLGGS